MPAPSIRNRKSKIPLTPRPLSATPPEAMTIDPDIPNLQGAAVRRPWCVRLAVVLVLLGALLNVAYLWRQCPLDLSEDEAHYWEWARHLDYGYYSKGPGVAWIIAAAMSLGRSLGATAVTMPLVRMPAVVFAALTGLLSLALARRIFRDDRAALAVTLLSAGVPVFAVGSMLITIDSPMYCCWALALWALWRRVEGTPDTSGTPAGAGPAFFLYLAGIFTGLGMLAKPVVVAVPLCAAVAAWMSPVIRRRLATWHSAAATLLALAMQTPIIVWNARHGWLMFRHIGTQAGVGGVPAASAIPLVLRPLARLGLYMATQAGLLMGILFVLLVIAVVWALRHRKDTRCQGPTATGNLPGCHASDRAAAPAEACRQKLALDFLLAFTLPLWLFYAALSLWTNVEPNWPVASYFSGMILLGGVVAQRWSAPESVALRRWVTGAVIGGVVLTALGQHTDAFYPALCHGTFTQYQPRLKWDPTYRLHGLEGRALAIDGVCRQMQQETGQWPLVVTNRYDTSSSLAFYLPGQPFVYCLMSRVGGRLNQYDLWPGLDERDAHGTLVHQGQNAVLIGAFDAPAIFQVVTPAFGRVAPMEMVPVYDAHGLVIRNLAVWRCYDFKGLPPAPVTQTY